MYWRGEMYAPPGSISGRSTGQIENRTRMTPFQNRVRTIMALIARFMEPTWGLSGADRTQLGPMLAPRTLLSGSRFEHSKLHVGRRSKTPSRGNSDIRYGAAIRALVMRWNRQTYYHEHMLLLCIRPQFCVTYMHMTITRPMLLYKVPKQGTFPGLLWYTRMKQSTYRIAKLVKK